MVLLIIYLFQAFTNYFDLVCWFQARIDAAGVAFYSLKRLLTKRDANEKQRLRPT
jgi:hypothetical protein